MSFDHVDYCHLNSYFPIAEAVTALFRPHVEVVIHDLATKTIAYIANPISNRTIGASSAGDETEVDGLQSDTIGPYRKVNRDGHNLRSVTAILRAGDTEAIAVMCINFDVSFLENVGEMISAFAFLPGTLEPHAPFFHDNWQQALHRAIEEYENECGLAVRSMESSNRYELIRRLEHSRLLDVRNAPARAAERLGISRAALYKYLKTIRSSSKAGER